MNKKILSIGFGDIATRFAPLFLNNNCEVYALARSNKAAPKHVHLLRCDLSSERAKTLMIEESFDAVIITLTPDGYGEEAYKRTYVDNLEYLLNLWRHHNAPKFVVFVSSTAVYGQSDEAWVDEQSETRPERYNGQLLLAAEKLLEQSGLPHCVVRFSGIYGPGRNYLLRQVKSGAQGGLHFSNRIHSQDCAAILHFICEQQWQAKLKYPLFLSTDSEPVRARDIHNWLAAELGLQLTTPPSSNTRAGNKRCSNQRLIEAGYQFQYPTFREGYKQLLQLYQHEQPNTE